MGREVRLDASEPHVPMKPRRAHGVAVYDGHRSRYRADKAGWVRWYVPDSIEIDTTPEQAAADARSIRKAVGNSADPGRLGRLRIFRHPWDQTGCDMGRPSCEQLLVALTVARCPGGVGSGTGVSVANAVPSGETSTASKPHKGHDPGVVLQQHHARPRGRHRANRRPQEVRWHLRAETTATIAVERVFDVCSLVVLLFALLAWLPRVSWLEPAAIAAFACLCVIAILVVLGRLVANHSVASNFRVLARLPWLREEMVSRLFRNLSHGLAALSRPRGRSPLSA